MIRKVDNSSTEKILAKKKCFLDRERHIVSCALELLLELGVDHVTVSAIAKSAGIGKGTIYKHFLTKNEIYMRIVIDYEQKLAKKLSDGIKHTAKNHPSAATKIYFQSRLSRPALDRLVQQLEVRLEHEPEVMQQMAELKSIQHANVSALNTMVVKLINSGILEDVQPSFHFLSCWALAQGAVELFYNPIIEGMSPHDKQRLLEYISDIGVTMGNRGPAVHD